MFPAPPDIKTEIFTRLPDALRKEVTGANAAHQRGAGPAHSFLEGPSFDREGNLYCVDLRHGRIFRIDPAGAWAVFAEYDGVPNGLKIHRDGRLFVADAKLGLLSFDPRTGARSMVADGYCGERFGGLNDLCFADNGDLYFTDPGQASLARPIGRVFRLNAGGELELIMQNTPYPNGLVLAPDQATLYVAMTFAMQIHRLPLAKSAAGEYRWRGFIQLSGGLGPDGMAVDEAGNVLVVAAGLGTAWMFNTLGEPIARIRSCAGIRTTNLAFGGADRRSLYITEAEEGVILRARLDTPGRRMFSHS